MQWFTLKNSFPRAKHDLTSTSERKKEIQEIGDFLKKSCFLEKNIYIIQTFLRIQTFLIFFLISRKRAICPLPLSPDSRLYFLAL
jgi:hypothetical protein